jgi:hypothetical protein
MYIASMENIPVDPEESPGSILLATNPDTRGFIYKYLMGLTPVGLVICSFFLRILLHGMIPFLPDVTLSMIAPVGIFILAVSIGWAMRLDEVWTGSLLALGMSSLLAALLVNGLGVPVLTLNYIMNMFGWIAFLIQPFSVLAAIGVIAWTEKFRRSLEYTITREGVWLKGGVWKMQQHMLPHHQIGRMVMEQDFLGRRFHVGTVIPIGIAQWGSEFSLRGAGAGGQRDNIGGGLGYAKGRQEGSRHPLDCLYGIRDPEKVMAMLEPLICRPAAREEEQVSYLKKILEKI